MNNKFGVNIKFNKSLTTIQSKVNIFVRKDGHAYLIKTNVLNSLVVLPYDPNDPNSGTAESIAMANLIDVTDPLNPITIKNGVTLQVNQKDRRKPGSSDLVGFTLWAKNGTLLFSSKWNGVKTVNQKLDGGNLAIH